MEDEQRLQAKVYGVCLIAVILLLPNGLIAGIAEGFQKLFRRQARRPADRSSVASRPSEARQ